MLKQLQKSNLQKQFLIFKADDVYIVIIFVLKKCNFFLIDKFDRITLNKHF